MKRCRTKTGELKLRHEGEDYLLTAEGLDLPDDLAESIRPHVNVIVEDAPARPEKSSTSAKGKRASSKTSAGDEVDDE